ncbi:hypothetical protein JM79_1481 [Gramella sp. Hel_I_59]|nr:hypothetical protein JM79_1481 [Gramella sp. Hel_I_59]
MKYLFGKATNYILNCKIKKIDLLANIFLNIIASSYEEKVLSAIHSLTLLHKKTLHLYDEGF